MKEKDPLYTDKELKKLFDGFNEDYARKNKMQSPYTQKELKEFYKNYNESFAEKIGIQKAHKTEIEVIREINDLLNDLKAPKRPTRLQRIGKIADYFYYGGVVAAWSGLGIALNSDLEKIGIGVTVAGLTAGLSGLITRIIAEGK